MHIVNEYIYSLYVCILKAVEIACLSYGSFR